VPLSWPGVSLPSCQPCRSRCTRDLHRALSASQLGAVRGLVRQSQSPVPLSQGSAESAAAAITAAAGPARDRRTGCPVPEQLCWARLWGLELVEPELVPLSWPAESAAAEGWLQVPAVPGIAVPGAQFGAAVLRLCGPVCQSQSPRY
jgi:hypothetical protein